MNNKGFSLIELLAVIVVLALILVISFPSIGKMVATFREKDQIEMLKNSAVSAAKEYIVDGEADTSTINCNGTSITDTIDIYVITNLINEKYLSSNDWYQSTHKISVTYDCDNKKFIKYEFKES